MLPYSFCDKPCNNESIVYTGWLTCQSMDFVAYLMLPQGQNKLICMNKPTHSGSRIKGRVYPGYRDTCNDSPKWIYNFHLHLKIFFADSEQTLLKHWHSSIILSTFRVFHPFTRSPKFFEYQLCTRNWCKHQEYSDYLKSHGPYIHGA